MTDKIFEFILCSLRDDIIHHLEGKQFFTKEKVDTYEEAICVLPAKEVLEAIDNSFKRVINEENR